MNNAYHFPNCIINGRLKVPGDKSMSHRGVLLAAMAKGQSVINGLLDSEDCKSTIEACQALGVDIQTVGQQTFIESPGISSWRPPKQPINLGNSGTTARLLSGVLAAFQHPVKLTGDESLKQRPMKRVIGPLSTMGARFTFEGEPDRLPFIIQGSELKSISYELPLPSAQVKSAILLAGMSTYGKTIVREPIKTRDHTEKMVKAFGGTIDEDHTLRSVEGKQFLKGAHLTIPGDPSSAAFWIAATVITPNSELQLEDLSLNETRIGFIRVLQRMGASIDVTVKDYVGLEPVGDVYVRSSTLMPTSLSKEEIPSLIDEVPLLALVATQTEGTMTLEHINELRFKETDRIHATVEILNSLGANLNEEEESIKIEGKSDLKGGHVTSYNDHRMAMLAVVASFISNTPVIIDNIDCINISYPNFFQNLNGILQDYVRDE
ncbi:3-phosphoshikimate 1-carboxyvinyltransferase [Alkalibacillus salilacus]|uniref:3-phosphoshikimate 1-carboxyvinyltransferase n=1 Tax=Alkalibacillus salilacus TaxID=284582 RepID=A0ABT9VC16_9BACI|nr:3-phosphoshikimate 1-carboxyvinyltransferase [Alkalibacillus salilacus]MDQ0158483.1 3-phosphoshikimate 1-carboxyvinyltransferase [Alkalibacillus salilacus]